MKEQFLNIGRYTLPYTELSQNEMLTDPTIYLTN